MPGWPDKALKTGSMPGRIAGHTDYDVRRDSPYTVRVIHDGPEPRTHLQEYADFLTALGDRTTIEKATDIRPIRLKITRA
ncbi:hypothetical protein ACFUAC_10010 [Streptomyces sp. NPDC057148]|uniref:hypothetical protein n=1 Tax=Streptomyces sp. NPDC057148 TaxID=3346035 RepID=UPI00363A921E